MFWQVREVRRDSSFPRGNESQKRMGNDQGEACVRLLSGGSGQGWWGTLNKMGVGEVCYNLREQPT